jgi:hypothetical protein
MARPSSFSAWNAGCSDPIAAPESGEKSVRAGPGGRPISRGESAAIFFGQRRVPWRLPGVRPVPRRCRRAHQGRAAAEGPERAGWPRRRSGRGQVEVAGLERGQAGRRHRGRMPPSSRPPRHRRSPVGSGRRRGSPHPESRHQQRRLQRSTGNSTSNASTNGSIPALSRDNTHSAPDRPAHFRRAAPKRDGTIRADADPGDFLQLTGALWRAATGPEDRSQPMLGLILDGLSTRQQR